MKRIGYVLLVSFFIAYSSCAMIKEEPTVKKQKVEQAVSGELELGKLSLQKALHNADIKAMRKLLEQFDENEQKWLVNQKMETHTCSNEYEHFLVIAYEKGAVADFFLANSVWLPFIEDILKKGADPNVADQENRTILSMAIMSGCMLYVDLFLKYGANPNTVIFFGRSMRQLPLDYIAREKIAIEWKIKSLKDGGNDYKSWQSELNEFKSIEESLQKAIQEYPAFARRKEEEKVKVVIKKLRQELKQKDAERILQRVQQCQDEQSVYFLRSLKREK